MRFVEPFAKSFRPVVHDAFRAAPLAEPIEREARLSLGSEHVWMEENQPVTVRVHVEPLVPADEEAIAEQEGEQTG